ncbi:ABC transporter permease [Streptomyces sp. CC53]|uniref:ABC transporter permease n=1 Tax=unclassified Streptomyces TaxID=2593676 RepID=UPI0008DDD8DE|nr:MULTISPECIES: ABC transporter permease [unclassified Streptomyces]OII65387.1 ABC transporter permease [Streptomyces sp. CC53]OII67341.1 ABC transporter permease [Streptomyces sp. CC77]
MTTAAPYTSPIPVRPARLGDAITAEWTKMRSLRSTMWTLGVMTAVVVGVGFLLAFAIGQVPEEGPDSELAGSGVLELGIVGMLLGSVCVITLGVLTVTSEYGTGLIRATLTACPSRGRILAAKSIVFFAVVFTITTAVSAASAAVQTAMLPGAGGAPTEHWLRATVGVGLFMALLGLLSLAVGTLLRHSAGAITTMIGVVLLPFVLAIGLYAESLTDLRTWLVEYSIPSQLAVLYSGQTDYTGTPSGWDPLWIMGGVAAVALAGAYAALTARDV